MERKGLSAKSTVSVIEIMSVHKHRFKKETFTGKGDIHSFPEIIYSLEGDIPITVDNKEHIITTGEMFIYKPNSYHVLTHPTNAAVLIISFVPGYERISKIYNQVIKLDHETQRYFVDTVEEIVENITFSVNDRGSELRLRNGVPQIQEVIMKGKFEIFLLMLEKAMPELFESNEIVNEELSKVISNFENDISANYTISEMAKLNMMSESKLKKLFRANLNTSPVAYFQRIKIDYAKTLLLERKNNITEISEKLGFQSIHYFSRFFKKHTGVCPTEYIKAIDSWEYL